MKNEYPEINIAKGILYEAEKLNSGDWIKHSENVALAARNIATACSMDTEKAYVCGLLHDIGRRFGITYMKHTVDGYNYCCSKDFNFVAKICLTHSFPTKNVNEGLGKQDWSKDEYDFVNNYLSNTEYDDYDKLIQLCDGLGFTSGFCFLEKRLVDAVIRHGVNEFIVDKWKKIFEIKAYFETIIGSSIYSVLPEVEKNF